MAVRGLIHLLLFLALEPRNANLKGDALFALRKEDHDPDNVLQRWDPTLVDPCTRFHVTCDAKNCVTRLDLGNAKLSGKLVLDLGKIERLQYLYVQGIILEHLVGPIPVELGNLKSLVSLDLYHNNLTVSIPSWLHLSPTLQPQILLICNIIKMCRLDENFLSLIKPSNTQDFPLNLTP